MSRLCSVCNKPMYEDSYGGHQCRNFDCPPGNKAAHERSWKLKDELQPLLLKQSASLFTVEEISKIIHADAGKDCGPKLLELAKRCGIR